MFHRNPDFVTNGCRISLHPQDEWNLIGFIGITVDYVNRRVRNSLLKLFVVVCVAGVSLVGSDECGEQMRTVMWVLAI